MEDFRDTIWNYYHDHGRHELPWRLNTSPYAVTVSEIMLQQTQVVRVIEKFNYWLGLFPDWQALAGATNTEVLAAWQGLGYNRRGLYLKRAAETVVSEMDGDLAPDVRSLMKLPGIGPNTAGAILAYAFEQPVVFIETNIRRVFIHHFFTDQDEVSDTELWPLIEQAVDRENPREWYWALMDYGAFLATQGENPNRRSKHYARQSKFEGSARQIRGEVVRQLINGHKTASELRAIITDERLPAVLDGLVRDQMIELESSHYQISAK